jgi:drug/metabolite transporter (DMT)-like permease
VACELKVYNPRTGEIIRAREAPGRLVVFGITAIVCGVLVAAAHGEVPFLSYWIGACSPNDYAYECASRLLHGAVVGAGAAVLIGGLSLAGHRFGRIPPTLTSRL